MKDNDASFASLQDSNEKLCGFLDWLLDAIEVHNCNPRRKPTPTANAQLCDECQMGVAGQADGWDPGSDMLNFTRAKQLQADLYSRIARQYV